MVSCPSGFPLFGDRLRDSIRLEPLLAASLNVRKGNEIYRCGDNDDNVYLIESGQIKILALSEDAKECLLAIYTAGDLFGELCLTGVSRVDSATAMKDSVLKKMRCDSFLQRLKQASLHEAFLKYVLLRVADQQKIIRNLLTADSEHRLAATLLQLAQKLGKQDMGSLRIEKRISHQELSEMVGTTRSRIGFFLRKFRELGIIVSDPKGYLIVKEANLRTYLEADIQRHLGYPKK
jgi:CRP/FNR family cyclic AMP-dependent transcriptional regulator